MNHFMGKFLQSLILRQFEVEWDTWATIQGIVAQARVMELLVIEIYCNNNLKEIFP